LEGEAAAAPAAGAPAAAASARALPPAAPAPGGLNSAGGPAGWALPVGAAAAIQGMLASICGQPGIMAGKAPKPGRPAARALYMASCSWGVCDPPGMGMGTCSAENSPRVPGTRKAAADPSAAAAPPPGAAAAPAASAAAAAAGSNGKASTSIALWGCTSRAGAGWGARAAGADSGGAAAAGGGACFTSSCSAVSSWLCVCGWCSNFCSSPCVGECGAATCGPGGCASAGASAGGLSSAGAVPARVSMRPALM
jgi:hypothetical protein